MKTPLISIVLPVYNGARYLSESIDSMLSQTYKEFELILIDDGSTDESLDMMQSYESRDSRVRLITQQNMGVAKTLNRGVNCAQGDYIARMDADDICVEDRLSLQLDYIRKNSFDMIGSAIRFFGKSEDKILNMRIFIRKYFIPRNCPLDNASLKASILTNGRYIAHPTLLARTSLLRKVLYPEVIAEDIACWAKMSVSLDVRIGSMPNILLYHRIHDDQVTRSWVCKYGRKGVESMAVSSVYSEIQQKIPSISREMLVAFFQLARRNNLDKEQYSLAVDYLFELLRSKNLDFSTKRELKKRFIQIVLKKPSRVGLSALMRLPYERFD